MANSHYRNRELLDLAYKVPCMLRLPCCIGGTGEPAHSNQSRHGKGGSIKAHDCFFASGCRACHVELDQGRTLTREEKFEVWQRGHEATMLFLFQRGYLRVVSEPS